jgi:aspartyl-tRNA(Asn)/glutamyl-tRNA(Gln) amidotransferase subunit C
MEIKELQETAELARLGMNEQELQEILPAFNETLKFFSVLQQIDIPVDCAESMPVFQTLAASEQFRSDNPNPCESGINEEMLQKAGERDGNFIVIPNVL